jgi:hypothetical protein
MRPTTDFAPNPAPEGSSPAIDSLFAAWHAWRAITSRQWAWTTAIALFLLLAYIVGLSPILVMRVTNLLGPPLPSWNMGQTIGMTICFIAAAYCFLLAIAIAERGRRDERTPVRRYVVAGIAAFAAAIFIENLLYLLAPGLAPRAGGWTPNPEMRQMFGRIAWTTTNFGLSGGLALAVYVRFRSARFARETLRAAEMERLAASREVLASRLAAMQARIEPQFLLGTLTQVEALYDRDPQGGDRMLDALIIYLRTALPQLRSERSTLAEEVRLAESYLRIVQLRMGSRLSYTVSLDAGLGDNAFPPMLLLPLVDDAIRTGLEPLAHGGTIEIGADVDGDRLRVRVADDGMPRATPSDERASIATLHERLRGLYGDAARLELANAPQGVVATIEVPLESARSDR